MELQVQLVRPKCPIPSIPVVHPAGKVPPCSSPDVLRSMLLQVLGHQLAQPVVQSLLSLRCLFCWLNCKRNRGRGKELQRQSPSWGLTCQYTGKDEGPHLGTVFIPHHYDMLSLQTHTQTQAHTERDIQEACQGRPILPGPDSKQLEQKAAAGRSRHEQETRDRGQVDTEFLA